MLDEGAGRAIEGDRTVSICIPIYNGERYLRDCLDSVFAQTRCADEVVIVDDGSTDRSEAIVDEYRRREPGIRYVRNPANLGLVGNWNRCVELASAQWIKFVFQDDLLDPRCLERMMQRTTDGPDLVACRRGFLFEVEPSDDLRSFYLSSQSLIDSIFAGREGLDAEACRALAIDQFGHNLFGEPSSVLFRRSAFERYGHFRVGLVMSCDLEYWIRLSIHGGASFVHDTLSQFRIHSAATSADNLGRRSFRMYQLDNLLLLRDYAYAPVYKPLREHAARRVPPCDFSAMVKERSHQAVSMARWLSSRSTDRDSVAPDELRTFGQQFPELRVGRLAHASWRAKRWLRNALGRAENV